MGINAALEAISARLKEVFPGLKACEVHPGRFDEPELKRTATRTPALFVACIGVGKIEPVETEQVDVDLLLGAFVVTASTPALPRDAAARNLVEAILLMLPTERWGLAGCGEAKEAHAENLYGSGSDAQGVALWAVGWRQKLRLGTSVWAGGTLPAQLYLGITPDIGAAHVNDYVAVEEIP